MRQLGIGVIGLGTHARRGHIDHLGGLPARLVAVCDTDPAKLRDFPKATGHLSTSSLLSDPAVDAVMVMTPDRFHIGIALAALAEGKHVFVEKPIIDRAEDEARLVQAIRLARERGLVLTTCHPRRFDRPFLWLRENLGRFSERFGEPLEFRFDFSYAEAREDTAGHHRSLLLDHYGHEIDLLHFLFGRRPFRAHALVDRPERYQVAGVRDDGMTFSFQGSRLLRRESAAYPEACAVRFARGEVSMDMQSGTATLVDRETGIAGREACGTTDYEGRFRAVNEAFVRASLGEGADYLEAEDLLVNNLTAIALADEGTTRWGLPAHDPRVRAAIPDLPRGAEPL